MRLDKITIAGILGIARAEINLKGVTVIAGLNHVGKSSIADAISMALLGSVSRLSIPKKEYEQLLHDGSPKGRVLVTYDGCEEEDGAQFRLPKGEHMVGDIENSKYLPYVLRPQLFADISDDERRTLLFNLTGCKAGGKEVIAKLIARGIPESVVRDFIPNLKNGFPAASAAAADLAKSSKGAWRGITKANWGAVVAESWAAPKPEGKCPSPAELDELLKRATKRQNDLEEGISYIAQQEAIMQSTESHRALQGQLVETAGLISQRQEKKKTTEKDLAELEGKLPPLLDRLAEAKAASTPLVCPCCDKELSMVSGKLELFAGLKSDTKVLSDAALAVTNARSSIDTLKRALASDLRDIAESEAAAKQLADMQSQEIETVDMEKLEKARDAVSKLRTKAAAERAEFNEMQQRKFDFEKVKETTDQAAAAHAEVKQWLSIADALAPDGIPSELLADAMAPFNQSLQVLAGLCDWKKVDIGADMQLRYGGRLYGLCSVSEKWRCNTLVALAIAQMSTLKMVVLDGFDVLDLKSRGSLVRMAIELEELTAMESIVLVGTLKEAPKMPPNVAVVWVERCIAEN